MTKLAAFSWGYAGWGNAVEELLESTRLAEEHRGFGPPYFVDVRFSRQVRAIGFKDHNFEQLAGPANCTWMPRLGNKNIADHGDTELADPRAASDLLALIEKMQTANRRVIYFCSCEAPAAPDGCHRGLVTKELLALALKKGVQLEIQEWPGERPSGKVDVRCKANAACTRAARGHLKWLPLPPDLEPGVAASLPWGTLLQLGADGSALWVLTGPTTFRSGKWMLPNFMSTEDHAELGQLLEEAPYVSGEKSHQDDPVTVSPALAAIIGAGPQSQRQVVKAFWAYLAEHHLVEEGGDVRVDAKLRGVFGPVDKVSFADFTYGVNAHLGIVGDEAGADDGARAEISPVPSVDGSIARPQDLLRIVERLSAEQPLTDAFSSKWQAQEGEHERKAVWYSNQREHWIGWLRQWDGPGAYGRQDWDRSARYVYQHINNPQMLVWLCEAAAAARPEALSRQLVEDAANAALSKTSMPGMASAFRHALPWELVESALVQI